MRQVTNALLTRPPLSLYPSIRKLPHINSVRLACVRHAASVHPEPGSNSQIKFVCPDKHWLFVLESHLFFRTVFRVCDLSHVLWNFSAFAVFWKFQGCFIVQLSRFIVCLSRNSFNILPHFVSYVNNFFKLFLMFEQFAFFDSSDILSRLW